MPIRLEAIEGPLAGAAFDAIDGEMTIGRENTNTLADPTDNELSRVHCTIVAADDGLIIRDHDSLNGTRVNGEIVQQASLRSGDTIHVGQSVFRITILEAVNATPDDDRPIMGTPVTLSANAELPLDTVFAAVAGSASSAAAVGRATSSSRTVSSIDRADSVVKNPRLVGAMLQLCAAITSERRVDGLLRRLIDVVLETFAVRRIATYLVEDTHRALKAPLFWTALGGHGDSFKIPQLVQSRIVDSRAAFYINDAHTEAGPQSATITHANIHAIMATPIIAGHRDLLGGLYLDATDSHIAFHEEDLQTLRFCADVIASPLANAITAAALANENDVLRKRFGPAPLIGNSGAMREVLSRAEKVAATRTPVLLLGETGTGKTTLARAIHKLSPRAKEPFVEVDCTTISEAIAESELFGHEPKSFTGADSTKVKIGLVEAADGGTLFLDEIGELSLAMQGKLLTVLESHTFRRVGATKMLKTDIRVIAATNKDLDHQVTIGLFRRDLHQRLKVFPISVPPLRDRPGDIRLVATHFLKTLAAELNKPHVQGFTDEAMACLMAYKWGPGNIRELRNAIEFALIMVTTDEIVRENLPELVREATSTPIGVSGTQKWVDRIRDWKLATVMTALREAGGVVEDAANSLGMEVPNMYRIMKGFNLTSEAFSQNDRGPDLERLRNK